MVRKIPSPIPMERVRACPGLDPGVRVIFIVVGECKLMKHSFEK
jgi:hypothetical protein